MKTTNHNILLSNILTNVSAAYTSSMQHDYEPRII